VIKIGGFFIATHSEYLHTNIEHIILKVPRLKSVIHRYWGFGGGRWGRCFGGFLLLLWFGGVFVCFTVLIGPE